MGLIELFFPIRERNSPSFLGVVEPYDVRVERLGIIFPAKPFHHAFMLFMGWIANDL